MTRDEIKLAARNLGYEPRVILYKQVIASFVTNTAAFDLIAAAANHIYFVDKMYFQTMPGNPGGGVPTIQTYDLSSTLYVLRLAYQVAVNTESYRQLKNTFLTRMAFDPNGCVAANFVVSIHGNYYDLSYA